MNRTLDRLGRFAATHPWRTVAAWLVLAVAVFGIAGAVGGQTQEDWDVPAAPAQQGVDLLREHLPASGNTSAQVVVHDDAPLAESELTALTNRLASLDHVLTVTPPRMSADGDTALITAQYDVPVTHRDVYGHAEPLEQAIWPTQEAGVQVVLGGELPSTAGGAMKGTGELIGIVVALLILLLMFRSVVAAGLPVVVAVAGLAVGGAGIAILCGVMSVSPFAPTVATMVGLGVGIDYALLILVRALEYRRAGFGVVDAAAASSVTAGRSVVLAGTTVLVSLLGLRLSGLATFGAFGFATAITVVAVMVTALLLVPALFALTHRWIEPRAVRRARKAGSKVAGSRDGTSSLLDQPRSERWARRVAGRPLPWLIGAATVMVLLAAPVLDMRTWPGSGGDEVAGTPLRQSFDLISEEYGPGANTPLMFVADREVVGDAGIDQLAASLEARSDIVNVSPAVVSPDGAIALVTAESVLRDNDERVAGQIADLRAALPAGVELTGSSVMFSDIVDILATRIWLVIGFVVGTPIFLDATLVRMILVPATMTLLGERNWWLPAWLDRILPRVQVEAPEPAATAVASSPGRELEPVG